MARTKNWLGLVCVGLQAEISMVTLFNLVKQNQIMIAYNNSDAACMKFRKLYESETVEKFEALIFSGLAPTPDKVPTTFDGMDQFVEIIKAARGK